MVIDRDGPDDPASSMCVRVCVLQVTYVFQYFLIYELTARWHEDKHIYEQKGVAIITFVNNVSRYIIVSHLFISFFSITFSLIHVTSTAF